MEKTYHIAEINISRVKAPLDDPLMAGFVGRLAEINTLADGSPGFVWRLEAGEQSSAYLRPYEDEKIIVNLSVWETIDALKHYVYRTAHTAVMRQRQEWFEKLSGAHIALWWVPVGHTPSIDEAKKRLAYLDAHGPTQFAFDLKTVFQPDEQFQRAIDWASFERCPAV
jgi:hypothetical protein